MVSRRKKNSSTNDLTSSRDFSYIECLYSSFEDWEEEKDKLQRYLDRLNNAMKAHPETSKEPKNEENMYFGCDRYMLETEAAILTGLLSQQWQSSLRHYDKINRQLQEAADRDPYQDGTGRGDIYYTNAEKNMLRINKELRKLEEKIDNVSVMTWQIIEDLPAPEKKVLRPGSNQPISSD